MKPGVNAPPGGGSTANREIGDVLRRWPIRWSSPRCLAQFLRGAQAERRSGLQGVQSTVVASTCRRLPLFDSEPEPGFRPCFGNEEPALPRVASLLRTAPET